MAERLTDDEIRGKTQSLFEAAEQYVENSGVESERETTLRFYRSRPYGDEREGMSQFVTAEVLEAVTWILPGVNKKFTYSERAVEFMGTGDPNELGSIGGTDAVRDMMLGKISDEFASQATELCNYDFYEENDGFKIFEGISWDGNVSKTGIMKHYWGEDEEQTFQRFFELDPEAVEDLFAEDFPDNIEVEYTELRRYPGPVNPDYDPDDEESKPNLELVDIEVKRTATTAGVKLECVAPEDFLVLPGDDYVHEGMRGCFERIHKARWMLLDMGIDEDVALSIPSMSVETEEIKVTREGASTGQTTAIDPWQEEVVLIQAHVHMDADGDGKAEILSVLCGGDSCEIFIEAEAVSEIPYTDFCPFRIPHTFYGDCVADRVADLQRLSSENIRQQLDYGVELNTPTVFVGKGGERKTGETIGDLNERSTGGQVRVEDVNQIKWDRPPEIATLSAKIDQWIKQKTVARTGASEVQPASDPNSLQPQSATEVHDRRMASDEIKDWIAASFADSMKRVFKRILALEVRHATKPKTIRVGDQFKTIDPRILPPDMRVKTNVGLGAGTKEQAMRTLLATMEKQKELIEAFGFADDNPSKGFVSRNQYYNTCRDFIRAAGFDEPDRYFSDPTGKGEQQIPDEVIAQIEAAALEKAQQSVMVQLQKYAIDKQAETDISEAVIKAKSDREATAQKERDSVRDAQTKRFEVIESESTERQSIAARVAMGEEPRIPR